MRRMRLITYRGRRLQSAVTVHIIWTALCIVYTSAQNIELPVSGISGGQP